MRGEESLQVCWAMGRPQQTRAVSPPVPSALQRLPDGGLSVPPGLVIRVVSSPGPCDISQLSSCLRSACGGENSL